MAKTPIIPPDEEDDGGDDEETVGPDPEFGPFQ